MHTPCGSVVLISEGMDGGGILLQRVVHSGIKRQYMLNEANFMFYSIKLSVRSHYFRSCVSAISEDV